MNEWQSPHLKGEHLRATVIKNQFYVHHPTLAYASIKRRNFATFMDGTSGPSIRLRKQTKRVQETVPFFYAKLSGLQDVWDFLSGWPMNSNMRAEAWRGWMWKSTMDRLLSTPTQPRYEVIVEKRQNKILWITGRTGSWIFPTSEHTPTYVKKVVWLLLPKICDFIFASTFY